MAKVYLTALFAGDAAAADAKAALAKLQGVTTERVFVIHRDAEGFHVDGRFAGEAPQAWYALLGTALARILRGTSDAEQELGVGQAALVALIDERTPDVADAAIHQYGGVVIRAAPQTLDAEDTERFLSAAAMPEFFVPKTKL